jgi:hypothetical protein
VQISFIDEKIGSNRPNELAGWGDFETRTYNFYQTLDSFFE